MFESLKNTFNNIAQNVTAKLVPPPTKSAFREKGTLTPDEYIAVRSLFSIQRPVIRWYSSTDLGVGIQLWMPLMLLSTFPRKSSFWGPRMSSAGPGARI
jgi:hypothetical protein